MSDVREEDPGSLFIMTPQRIGEMENRTIKTITCSFGGKTSPFWTLQLAMLHLLDKTKNIVFSQLECTVRKFFNCNSPKPAFLSLGHLLLQRRLYTPTTIICTLTPFACRWTAVAL